MTKFVRLISVMLVLIALSCCAVTTAQADAEELEAQANVQ